MKLPATGSPEDFSGLFPERNIELGSVKGRVLKQQSLVHKEKSSALWSKLLTWHVSLNMLIIEYKNSLLL